MQRRSHVQHFFKNRSCRFARSKRPCLFPLDATPPPPDAAEIEREEEAVYSLFVGDGPAVILQNTDIGFFETAPGDVEEYAKSGMDGVSNQTLESYIERNSKSSSLSPDMNLGVDYFLLSQERLKEIASQSNWGEVLSEAYPGADGYRIFSRVGFNNTLDQALIYVGEVYGPLAGSGSCYLMEKQNGEWIIKDMIDIWIS